MPLTDEQAKLIKEQILKQVENFPEDKRTQAEQYIKSLNNEQLEEFVMKNNLVKSEEKEGVPSSTTPKNECIYCNIGNKTIDSLPIYEDKDYIAVLEIKPFSPGHTILLPKEHTSEAKLLKNKAFSISKKIGKHLIKKLKAKDFQLTTSDELRHAIINIIPSYKDVPITYERKPSTKEELQNIAMKIGKIEKKVRVKKEKEVKIDKGKVNLSIIKLPRRIP